MIFDKQWSNWVAENLQWIARFGKNCRGHADELDGKRDMLVWWRLLCPQKRVLLLQRKSGEQQWGRSVQHIAEPTKKRLAALEL